MNTAFAELTFHRAAEPGFGLPEDRLARMAARQAFVEMKTSFMRAAADIEGTAGRLLQRQVRQCAEVIELWRLRHAVMGALPHGRAEAEQHRLELQRQLDSAFPEGCGGTTAFMPL